MKQTFDKKHTKLNAIFNTKTHIMYRLIFEHW